MARVIGMDAHIARLKGMSGDRIAGPLGEAVFATADQIKADAQVSITEGSVGGKFHVPSNPGEPPNEDTGFLASHIESAKTGPITAEVTSNAPYSIPLEFGTSKMAERPYMRPAAEKNRGLLAEKVALAVNHIIESGA